MVPKTSGGNREEDASSFLWDFSWRIDRSCMAIFWSMSRRDSSTPFSRPLMTSSVWRREAAHENYYCDIRGGLCSYLQLKRLLSPFLDERRTCLSLKKLNPATADLRCAPTHCFAKIMKAEAFQVNQQRLGNCPASWKVNIQTRCLSLLLTNGPAPQGMINWNDLQWHQRSGTLLLGCKYS